MSILRLDINTLPPPSGAEDHAPKKFYGPREIANVLELIVASLRMPLYDPGVFMWCGRPIATITLTQYDLSTGFKDVGEGI